MRYGLIVTDYNGRTLLSCLAETRQSAMARADAEHPQSRFATVRTDRTSDGSYHGPGGGRVVASREHGRWLVDHGDSTTDARAF